MRKVLSILGQWSDDDIEWLMEAGGRATVPAGFALIEEGRTADWLYIVLDGTFSVTVDALNGGEVAQLEAGEILGEMSFVDHHPPSATVTALRDSIIYQVDRQLLAAHLATDHAFASRFYRSLAIFLAGRLRNAQNRLGAGSGRAPGDDDPLADELDEGMLDQVNLAAARFDWLLKRLMGA